MKYIDEFRNKSILKNISRRIKKISLRGSKVYNFMEVCGTHTMNIFKFALQDMLPENIRLISGPGCPVCVTPVESIDRMLAYSRLKDVLIVTFGDMIRVPGSTESLLDMKAKGAKVKLIYSPLEAINIANMNPGKNIILVGIGFETTAPLFAKLLLEAKNKNIKNLFVLSLHKTMPEALFALLKKKDVDIDGFILPAHVSTIIGSRPYEFISEKFNKRCVIAGFEPTDIMQGILNLLMQKTPKVEIQYDRVVKKDGNKLAIKTMEEVFKKCDSEWRGLGIIKNSGLKIKEEFKEFDADKRFGQKVLRSQKKNNKLYTRCICGEVLKGKKEPLDCSLFARICTPSRPVGACMVSSEGTCAAYFKYRRT